MFKKIIVPIEVDYPDAAKAVYQKAAALAKLSNAEIQLVSVVPGFGMPIVASYISDELRQEATDRFKKVLEEFVKSNCDKNVSFKIRTGKNWEEIIKAADKWGADLIIVYHNRRRDVNEIFSHSCSQRVSDHAKCSVLRLRNIQS